MRLICTITDTKHENAMAFSYYLTSQGIENQCEEIEGEEPPHFRLWIYDEDDVEKAQELYRSYQANPLDPQFKAPTPSPRHVQNDPLSKFDPPTPEEQKETPKRSRRFLSPSPYGPISVLILLSVIGLFILSQMQRSTAIPPNITGVAQAPILSPLEKKLIYDYPTYFSLRDELLSLYTPEEIEAKKPPSTAAKELLQKLWQTPVWMGFYDKIVDHFRNPGSSLSYTAPLFEKIRQGEIWRLFTPALLHFDLLHIFFNLIWFILLGNQIEFRIGWKRYLLFILATGIISNTAQYLMSGPFFMGLSGIVVGMAAFIWAR